MEILRFFLKIVETPALMLGLVTMIGLLLQKKSFGVVFSGTIKTAIGMLIVSAGAGLIVSEIIPFSNVFSDTFNLEGIATGSETIAGALSANVPTIASTSALIMGIGFLVNIIIARFSPLKYIFLTGHMLWILSVVISSALYIADYSKFQIIIFGSIMQGVISVILPAIAQPSVEKVTKNQSFALGHLTTIGTVLAGYIGGFFGNKDNDSEKLKLPEQLNFFKDTAISISIIMIGFYVILFLIAGPDAVKEYVGDQNYIVFALLKGLGFTAGVLVLLQGVRLFLGELVPAFKGISDKLVPGSIPALDVPVLFGFAPNALMIGFMTSIVGMIVAMLVSATFLGIVPLVSIIGAFFTGGTAGIFGNARGGRRGAAIAGIVYGFALIMASATFAKLINLSGYGVEGVGHDCTDAVVISLLLKNPIFGMGLLLIIFFFLSFKKIRLDKQLKHDTV